MTNAPLGARYLLLAAAGENAHGRSGLSFLIGPDAAAVALRDEYLSKNGPGLLTRVATT